MQFRGGGKIRGIHSVPRPPLNIGGAFEWLRLYGYVGYPCHHPQTHIFRRNIFTGMARHTSLAKMSPLGTSHVSASRFLAKPSAMQSPRSGCESKPKFVRSHGVGPPIAQLGRQLTSRVPTTYIPRVKRPATSDLVDRLINQGSISPANRPFMDVFSLPRRQIVENILALARKIVFPGIFDEYRVNNANLKYHIGFALSEECGVVVAREGCRMPL